MRTNRRLRWAAAAVAFTAAVAVSPWTSSAAVAAEDPTGVVTLTNGAVVSTDPATRSAAEEDAYRDEVGTLHAMGELDAAHLEALGLEVVSVSLHDPGEAAYAAEETSAEGTTEAGTTDVGATVCNSSVVPTGGHSPTAMSLPAPIITRNASSQGVIYYAIGKWQWKSPPLGGSTCNALDGGRDGFGLALSKSVTNLGTSLIACSGNNKCSSTLASRSSNSAAGAGYTFQDSWFNSALSGWGPAYKGTLTYSFRPLSSGCLQAFSKYGHTWASTSVNGVGVGPWSISIQWSTSSSRWEPASGAGLYNC